MSDLPNSLRSPTSAVHHLRPATIAPSASAHPATNAPSWASVFSQLKSLVRRNLLATGAIVLLGAGALALTLSSAERARRRARERRRILRMVKQRFDQCRLDILKYLWESKGNVFDVGQLDRIYENFSKLLSNPKHGVLPLTRLAEIIREAGGVSDERVALSCARFFDVDGNCEVDFIEFVERLNLACFGSKFEQLKQYFAVFDLDGSGCISRPEVEEVLGALGEHGRRDPSVSSVASASHDAALSLFFRADTNRDGRITRAEFLDIASSSAMEHLSFSFLPAVREFFGVAPTDAQSLTVAPQLHAQQLRHHQQSPRRKSTNPEA